MSFFAEAFEGLHIQNIHLKEGSGLGAVAQAYNPSALGGQSGGITWAQEFKTSLSNMQKLRLYKIYKN